MLYEIVYLAKRKGKEKKGIKTIQIKNSESYRAWRSSGCAEGDPKDVCFTD